MNITDAIAVSLDLVKTKAQHLDYEHVVALTRDLYRPLATGKGIESLMRKFDPREDEKAFEQRKKITQHTTPSTWDTLMNAVRKLEAVDPVVDRIEYETENADRVKRMGDFLETFRGGKSLDHYIGSLTDIAEIDPNSFELMVFDPFDPRVEVPKPYAVHVSAEDAWNYSYFNEELQWFLLHRTIKYVSVEAGPGSKAVVKDGDRFVFYSDNHHIAYDQVRPDINGYMVRGEITDLTGNIVWDSPVMGDQYYLKVSDTLVYSVVFYDQNSGKVPLVRLGSRPDPRTEGRTMINTIHAAMPYLLKSVKQVSELDLTTALHVFPQKISYVRKCGEKDCNNGKLPSGNETCPRCKGSGQETIGTAQDHITLAMPDDPTEIVDLTKMIHYANLPVDIVQQMRDIVEETRANAIRAVYASDMYTKDQVNVTATAKLQELNNVYSALQPRVRFREFIKPYFTHVCASYLDLGEGLKVTTVMPQNLQYETAGDVVALMKEAQPVAGPAAMRVYAKNLINRLNPDDEQSRKKALVMEEFNPYSGMSQSEVLQLINGGQALEESATMWVESATIFDRAEQEYEGKDVSFYDLAPKKQREVVYGIRDRMIKEREERAKAKMETFRLGMDPDPDAASEDTEDPPNDLVPAQ